MKLKKPLKQKQKKESSRSPHDLTNVLFLLIKILLMVILVVFVMFLFMENTTKDVSIKTIEKEMEKHEAITELTQGDENTLKQMFSLDAAACENAIIYTSDSLMDVSELMIVKVDDPSQLADLEDLVQKHLDEQKNIFDGYGTDQLALLEDAILMSKGNYLFYGVSDEIETWEETFLSCIK